MTTLQLDDNSPYEGLPVSLTNGYALVTKRDHAIATGRNRVRVHRAVLHDDIGPGPHPCDYCGVDGLEWGLENSDPNNLTVDHANHDKLDCRRSNLRASHKYCNDNRFIVERLGIPWERIAAIPLASRPPLRTRDGEPTQAAHDLAATRPAIEESACSSVADEESGEAATSPAPSTGAKAPVSCLKPTGEHRMYAWGDFCDLADLARGVVTLKGPPEWLKAKHPALRKVDHLWGRK